MEKLTILILIIFVGCASDPCIEYKHSLRYMSTEGDHSVREYFIKRYNSLSDTLTCDEKRQILLSEMLQCDVNELKYRNTPINYLNHANNFKPK